MIFSSISIIVPTLNAGKVLGQCLTSIKNQDYPRQNLEIIIADGGSTDKTLEIAQKYGAKIYRNPFKTGEAGKAVALKHARGEFVALIDSDNILPDKNWLRRMIEPFSDPEIIGSEPWEFTYRRQDGFIDRYCALLGMNDPLCYFLGNYDRLNTLTGKWTGLAVEQEDKGRWLKVTLKPGSLPTIGANGTILRRDVFQKHFRGASLANSSTSEEPLRVTVRGVPLARFSATSEVARQRPRLLRGESIVGDYFFDIDIIAQLAVKNPVKFAKVKIGITHLYCGSDITKFIRKQKRRVKDFLYYQKIGARSYPWQEQNKWGLLKFILSCVTIWPLFYQALRGYFKKPDLAWFFHPLASLLTLWVYGMAVVEAKLGIAKMKREKWSQ